MCWVSLSCDRMIALRAITVKTWVDHLWQHSTGPPPTRTARDAGSLTSGYAHSPTLLYSREAPAGAPLEPVSHL
ncbi:hypothetical protein Hamer_G016439 [Homarus americanus]|uniref:Uncharacterized protein n=1 Tax=Homarus americanus TaxID=6706 RepID=A0A8J5N7M2_HOMAM|nr:hypothetical protein Hamer_G016439 [Homarus americanus]